MDQAAVIVTIIIVHIDLWMIYLTLRDIRKLLEKINESNS